MGSVLPELLKKVLHVRIFWQLEHVTFLMVENEITIWITCNKPHNNRQTTYHDIYLGVIYFNFMQSCLYNIYISTSSYNNTYIVHYFVMECMKTITCRSIKQINISIPQAHQCGGFVIIYGPHSTWAVIDEGHNPWNSSMTSMYKEKL